MAALTNTDFREVQRLIQGNQAGRDLFKSWSLSKPSWMTLFQAAEDWFTSGFNTRPATSFKAALDAVATTTVNQSKWIGKVWFMWRITQNW